MAKVWKISEAASIGLHAMVLLARAQARMVRTREIAEALKVSEAHLSKVLQRLAKVGLVSAIRGPSGGFSLKQDPDKITLLSVYEAIDGSLDSSPCLLETRICKGDRCILGGLIQEVNDRAREYLAGAVISELVDVYTGVEAPCFGTGPEKRPPARAKTAVDRRS